MAIYPPLVDIDKKLERAVAHIHNLSSQITAFTDLEPYAVRIKEDTDKGRRVARFIAVKNVAVGLPDVSMVLLAGEALYQLRSALDHLVHQLVILNGNLVIAQTSRALQFPIFDTPQGYRARAARMIDGVSTSVADLIEREQPYNRTAYAPTSDPLWTLQDLNNTDKHRLIPTAVIGLGVMTATSNSDGDLFTLGSDVVLEHDKVLFTIWRDDGRGYDDINPKLTCAIAFQQAMQTGGGSTISMDTMLQHIAGRVLHVINVFRPLFV